MSSKVLFLHYLSHLFEKMRNFAAGNERTAEKTTVDGTALEFNHNRMKPTRIILSLLLVSATATAQHTTDSTDVFYKHLQLNEVTVTGLTGQTKLRDLPAPVSVVTSRELRATAAQNIVDAIAHQPGVSQISTGSGIAKPVIRGLSYNRVLTVNDGVRQEGQQWGDEHGLEIDGESVSSIEILKGPASLMYGSDAMAGVLILHDAPNLAQGEKRVTVSGEYQTNNGLWDYSVNTQGHEGSWVWNARWTQKLAHAYKNKYDGYVPGTQFHERGAKGLVGLVKPWGHSYLTLSYFHLTPGIAEGERDALTGELVSSLTNLKSYDHGMPYQQVRHWKAVWDHSQQIGIGRLNAIIGYQQNRRQEFEDEEHPDEFELFFKLHTISYDLRYQLTELEGWKAAFGVGGMWQQSVNAGEEELIPDYKLFDIGAYATATRTLKRWILSGGLRADRRKIQHINGFTGVSASIGAVFQATDHLNFRLNLARGFRAPNMSELGSDGVHEGTIRYEQGNHNLKGEFSWQADLGADFSSRYVSAQVALFANRIENYIFAKRNGQFIEGYPVFTFTQGDARLLGFEASVDIHPIHSIHLGNSFSMVDAVQLHQPTESKYLPLTPAPRWTADLKWEITHNGRWLNNTYVSVGMDHNFSQNHYYMADDTETATPAYTLWNLAAGTDILIRGKKILEVYVTAANLTNKAYQNHLSRLKYGDENVVTGRRGVYNMGRNVVMKVVVPIRL